MAEYQELTRLAPDIKDLAVPQVRMPEVEFDFELGHLRKKSMNMCIRSFRGFSRNGIRGPLAGLRKSLVFADSRKIYSADSGTGASIAAVIGADRSVSDESLRMFSGELPAAGAAILRAGAAAQRVLLPTRLGALQGL